LRKSPGGSLSDFIFSMDLPVNSLFFLGLEPALSLPFYFFIGRIYIEAFTNIHITYMTQ